MSNTTENAVNASKHVASTWFDHLLNNPFVDFLWKLALAIVVVWVLIIISKIVAWNVKKKIIKNSIISDEDALEKTGNLVGDVVFYTLLTFDIFLWFKILWFDVWLLMWWLTFWIWLAFKEILWNMMAWIFILTTKEYTLWDIIKVEWWLWYFGYVEEITIRYTVLREFNNQKVIVPNLTLISSPIKTFNTEEFIRFDTIVSVHYDTDLEKVKEIIKQEVNKQKFIVEKEKTDVITASFWDSGIDLKVLFFIDPNAWIPGPVAISIINDVIKKVFDKNNINIPYPHTVVTVDKNDQWLLKTILFAKK